MLVRTSHRHVALVALLLPGGCDIHAGSTQGTLQVAVNVVALCEVAVADLGVATVNCPKALPYRVNIIPVAGVQVAATPGQDDPFLVGSQRLRPVVLPLASQAPLHGIQLTARTVTVLTISY